MKKSSLENFKKDIENIREYIKHIELINNIAKTNRNSTEKFLRDFNIHLRDFNISKKEFEYKAIIISLYGILENTISKWIQEHIQSISSIVGNYNNLEDKFKKEHFNLSIKLITLINENRHSKFEDMNKEDILRKLNQSLVSPNNFELNNEAYIPISGNLKHIKIVEAFKPLNIDLNAWSSTLHREIIKIDDLVVRRNDIAHGGKIDSMLGITEFEDFISALQKYMITIFDIISEQEIKYHFQEKNTVYIDEPKEFFKNNTVCIVNIKNIELSIGESIFIEKNNQFSEVKILNIKDNAKSINSVNNGEFGLELDTPIKKNSKIWKKII